MPERGYTDMKRTDINIRDPFILKEDGKYYMYGTRGETCFAKKAYGIDVYISSDLENWTGPIEVFRKPYGFWADRCFWAPEVHVYNGSYYMFATFGDGKHQGTMILKGDRPDGEFHQWSEGKTVTPFDQRCLDGTFYVDQGGIPYMIYCHEWKDVHDGEIVSVPLTEDLKGIAGPSRILFRASDGRPAIKALFLRNYVTDGPFMLRTDDGRLHMLWASFGRGGYVQAMAHSDNDEIGGKWTVDQELLYTKDGGHGMIFRTYEGEYMLVLHSPNNKYKERPVFIPVSYTGGKFKVSGGAI